MTKLTPLAAKLRRTYVENYVLDDYNNDFNGVWNAVAVTAEVECCSEPKTKMGRKMKVRVDDILYESTDIELLADLVAKATDEIYFDLVLESCQFLQNYGVDRMSINVLDGGRCFYIVNV